MFYPQEMTEIEIIVPTKHLLQVTKLVSGQGVFSQTDVNYLSSEKQTGQPNLWAEKAAAYSILDRRLQSIVQSLGIDKMALSKKELNEPVDVDAIKLLVDEVEKEVKSILDQISAETKIIDHSNSILQQLAALEDIDVDFTQLNDSRYVYSVLGMMPPENIERLRTSLSRIPFVLYNLSQKGKKAIVWLAGSHDNIDMINRAVRSAYLDPLTLPEGISGTPAQIIASLNGSIKTSEAKIDSLKEMLKTIQLKRKDQILDLLWQVRSSQMTAAAIVRYGKLKYTYVIVGWMYSSHVDDFKRKLHTISREIILETHKARRADAPTDVPTALVNPRLIRPFQSTVTNYAIPKYNEIDPTLIVAILFPLLFGAMFGDVGHGALIAIVGALVMSKKVKFLNFFGGLGPILFACGTSAAIFGFLYGSVMGFEDILKPIWIAPGANIMKILLITITGGVIVLIIGFLLNIYNLLVAKEFSEAILGHKGIVALLLYISLIFLAMPIVGKIFPVPASITNLAIPKTLLYGVFIIGVVCIWFSELLCNLFEGHRPLFEGSIGIYIFQGFFELFEVLLGFVSNSLSFVRVGAFAVAHGNLAAVFFILAGMFGTTSSVGYWIMYLVGLVFIVGFEGLIVYIQSTRLTYYETFGKFFTGGGKRFEPLTIQPAENA